VAPAGVTVSQQGAIGADQIVPAGAGQVEEFMILQDCEKWL
jgi:hypothetical protein